jgi:hypothetical protein
MLQSQLQRYVPLYANAEALGGAAVLRRHIGVADDFVLPLGLSHGVDFGQMHHAMETEAPEPIYWAYNARLLAIARRVKPALPIPHPFLLASLGRTGEPGTGTLVVGPPPGPTHDGDLLALIRGARDLTILVKPKQNFGLSAQFWRENGFPVVTIADDGPPSYDAMVRLFSRYDRVSGCTFSSALFFAAALGKPVDLIRGYRCRVWEVPDIERRFDFDSPRARDFGRLFAGDDAAAKIEMSRDLLGGGLDSDPRTLRDLIEQAVADLKEPLHFPARYPRPLRWALGELALRIGKPGIVSRSWDDLRRNFGRPQVVLQQLDEVALWLDGPTPTNPSLESHPYRRGKTIPGDAVDAY